MLMQLLTNLAKELTQSKRVFDKDWKYQELVTTPYLYGSHYLNGLLRDAKRINNYAQVLKIKQHIERHKVQYIDSYKWIINDCDSFIQRMHKKYDL